MRIVRSDDRDVGLFGQPGEFPYERTAFGGSVVGDLHIEIAAEDGLVLPGDLFCSRRITWTEEMRESSVCSAGEGDQAAAMIGEYLVIEARFVMQSFSERL